MNAHALEPAFDDLDPGRTLCELAFVRRLAASLLADENDADDVVQEAWLRSRALPQARIAGPGGLRNWLAAVTRRLARDLRRSGRRRAARERRAARAEALPSTLDVVERSAFLERLVRAVHALAEPYRTVVLWRYLDGRSCAEIARSSGISEEAVRKRLSRAIAALRMELTRELGADPRRALLAILGTVGPGPGAASSAAPAAAAPLWAKAALLGGPQVALLAGAAAAVVAAVPVAVLLRPPEPIELSEARPSPVDAPALADSGREAGWTRAAAEDLRADAGDGPGRGVPVESDIRREEPREPTDGVTRGAVHQLRLLEVGPGRREEEVIEVETRRLEPR
jgi:RNA polymerase sigma factor (sigma-70 family)